MKKLLGFASLLLIALLTACNADNLDEIVKADRADVVSEADRVPVVLCVGPSSTTTSVTRAPLDTDDTEGHTFSTPDGQYLGVFALAQTNTPAGGQAGPVATDAIMWDGTVQYARLLWNVPTKAIKTDTEPPVTYLQFLDKSTLNNQTPSASSYHYPRNNWYNYHFYSYYPRVDDANVSVTNNVVTADYTLDGSQDIITGVATPPVGDENNGFCRSYFEDIKNNPSSNTPLTPQLQLNKHHLAQLRFFVCSKGYVSDETVFQVKDITLKNVPTDWTLTIADKAKKNNTGTLTSRSAAKADFPVRYMEVNEQNKMLTASDDVVYVGGHATDLSTTKQCVGYAMIPPSAVVYKANNTLNRGFTNNYDISITIQLDDEEPVTLERTISEPQGGFIANKVYNIIVTIDQAAISGGEVPDDPRAVDLGLSVKWACQNIGASRETDKGFMFTWGGTTGYAASNSHSFSKANDPLWYTINGSNGIWMAYSTTPAQLASEHDAAATASDWGGEWRMPTRQEYAELINNTTKTWQTNYNGSSVNGYLFTSTKVGYTDKSIFIPVTGYKSSTSVSGSTQGHYWTSTLYSENNPYSFLFGPSNNPSVVTNRNRWQGLFVRAVKPKQ